jgi:L-fuculose-phosphate aldolase
MTDTGSRENFFSQSAEEINRQLDRDMASAIKTSGFSLREKVALACRKLADEGHARTLAGQITVRAAETGSFWTTDFAVGFAEATVGNLLRVDEEMQTLEGSGIPNPAVRFHLWIYRARPEISSIVHTHPPYSSALSMLGEQLAVAHMDAMVFYQDCAWLAQWPGVPVANEEGELIAAALGSKRSILLAHHGLLTVGKDLEEAVYLAVLLEQASQLTILARAIGEPRQVPPDLAQTAHDFLLKESIVKGTFDYWARCTARRHPEALR